MNDNNINNLFGEFGQRLFDIENGKPKMDVSYKWIFRNLKRNSEKLDPLEILQKTPHYKKRVFELLNSKDSYTRNVTEPKEWEQEQESPSGGKYMQPVEGELPVSAERQKVLNNAIKDELEYFDSELQLFENFLKDKVKLSGKNDEKEIRRIFRTKEKYSSPFSLKETAVFLHLLSNSSLIPKYTNENYGRLGYVLFQLNPKNCSDAIRDLPRILTDYQNELAHIKTELQTIISQIDIEISKCEK